MIEKGMKAADFTYCTAFKEGIKLSDKVQEADKTFLIFLRYMGCTSCQVDIIIPISQISELEAQRHEAQGHSANR